MWRNVSYYHLYTKPLQWDLYPKWTLARLAFQRSFFPDSIHWPMEFAAPGDWQLAHWLCNSRSVSTRCAAHTTPPLMGGAAFYSHQQCTYYSLVIFWPAKRYEIYQKVDCTPGGGGGGGALPYWRCPGRAAGKGMILRSSRLKQGV